jgi:hypothetical protein
MDMRHAQTQAEPFTEGGHLGRGFLAGVHGAMLGLKGRRGDEGKSRSTVLHRNAKIVRRLRETSLTFEAIQRIQQIAQGAGITWENRRRVFFSRTDKEI